jgi:hypothetical protein
MKKKITLVLIFLIICFSLGSYLVISNSNTSKKIKKFIPNNIKLLLKETIFIIPKLKKDNYEILEKLKLLDRDLAILKANNKKMLGVKIFDDPLKSKPYPNNTKLTKFFLTGAPHEFAGYQKTNFYVGRYVESFKKKLIIFDIFNFYTTTIGKNIFDIEKINLNEISTNIKDFTNLRGIRDMKIINDKIYLFAIFEDSLNSGKYNVEILSAELDFNKSSDSFEKFTFKSFLKFNLNANNYVQSGGRIDEFKQNHIIVSFGDFDSPKWDGIEDEFFSNNNYFGKIISINLNTKEIDVLSMGHRNPQGLTYIKNKNILINTEHGPKGGDEININFLDKIYNFGWPIASYGIRYNGEDPFQKNHDKFDEPVRHFSPSIAPSQIIPTFNDNSFYLASLKNTSIYEIKFSKDFSKIISENRIIIGERIRDIIHVDNDIYALTLDNSPAIAFFKDNN